MHCVITGCYCHVVINTAAFCHKWNKPVSKQLEIRATCQQYTAIAIQSLETSYHQQIHFTAKLVPTQIAGSVENGPDYTTTKQTVCKYGTPRWIEKTIVFQSSRNSSK